MGCLPCFTEVEKNDNKNKNRTDQSLNKSNSEKINIEDVSHSNIGEQNSTFISKISTNPMPINTNELNISFYEVEEPSDSVYNQLKKYEKEKLEEEYKNKLKNFIKQLDNLKLNIHLNNTLINQINENENCKNIFKNQIINKINSIKNKEEHYKIKHLTILVVGRKGIGKTTLINYMLEIKENNEENNKINQEGDFISYQSENVPHLKLVEFKGISLDAKSNPEIIGRETVKYINDHIEKNKNNDYNDFVHCIWYCITSSRFEKSEVSVLKKLSEAYEDSKMPIIVVYTKAINVKVANEMFEYINKQGVKTICIKILAKDMEIMNGSIKYAFGKDELINKTLEKCTQALKSDLINIMIKKISDDVKVNKLKENEKKEKEIKNNIITKFKEYKNVYKDEEFINYIIDMLIKNVETFLNDNEKDIYKISNSSYNLINKSNIINDIKKFIINYKKQVKDIIPKKIASLANDFIDQQSKLEKENSANIFIKNKRNIKGFRRTNEIFFKKKFYYTSQKYIIEYIIRNFCDKYFSELRKSFDSFIKEPLEKNDPIIESYLEDCFLTKLENFANSIKVKIKIEHNSNLSPIKINQKEEDFYKNELNTNSFDLGNDYNNSDNEIEKVNNNININANPWFPLKEKNWKYLENNQKILMENFLQNIKLQDKFFDKNSTDEVFESLKEYIKNDLTNEFYTIKEIFIKNKIDKVYNKKNITLEKTPIQNVIKAENINSIFNEKIKNEFLKFQKDDNYLKIDYLSIIIIGKCGVGKSTLINSMLKEQLAKVGTGEIVTEIESSYKSENMPFLRFIDTRGIELSSDFGPKQILKNTVEYIKNEQQSVIKSNNYNNYIQCLWYCFKDSIEPQEIEVIKELQENHKNLPLIIVYTNAVNKVEFQKMKNKINEKFDNIPFIPILAETIEGVMNNYGLNDLFYKTINLCKQSVKGDTFNKMKDMAKEKIKDIFKDAHKNIKKEINNKIVSKFIEEYNNILEDNKFLEFIIDLLEINFIEYMKSSNQNEKKELSSESRGELKGSGDIMNFISKCIDHYIKSSKEIINQISEKKGIHYLDIQAKKEIKEFKKSINVENKHDKAGFKEVLEKFLNDNFYYIAQKYIIYTLICSILEPYSEEVEKQINKIVEEIVVSPEAKSWYEELYSKKFEDFEERIKQCYKNGKIYEEGKEGNYNNIDNYKYTCNNKSDTSNKNEYSKTLNKNLEEENIESNYPEAPYPMF